MTTVRSAASIAWRLALVAVCIVIAIEVHLTASEARARAGRLEASLHVTLGSMDRLRSDLVRESAAWRGTSDAQATAYRTSLETQIEAARQDLSSVTLEAAQTLRAFGEVPDQVAGLRSDLQPAFHNLDLLTQHSDRAVQMWTPQVQGLVAGWKVVGGETALTMREWRRASPALIDMTKQIASNSNRTTEATARVMGNFAEATKPLPKWLRITLGVAPPLAQTAAGAATTLALTGR